MTGLPKVAVVNGALVIDGRPFPTTSWTMTAEPFADYATLRAELPVFDISEPDEAGVRLLYVARLSPTLDDLYAEAATAQEALRALADMLDARADA